MDAIALGPLLIALPRLYAFATALLLLAGALLLRLPATQRGRWLNGLWVACLLGARLGYVLLHADSYRAAPLDVFKLWQPGYLPLTGWLAGTAWTLWSLRHQPRQAFVAQGLLMAATGLWLGLMAWQPLGHDAAPQRLPEMTLEDLDGNRVRLSALGGEPLLVNLWASTCPACRRELPLLAEAAQRGDVRVVTINQGESLLEVARYLDQQGLDRPATLLDPHQRLIALSQAPGLPTTLYYAADGTLLISHAGEFGRAQLDAWLDRGERVLKK
ncbi:TlpA disulfide reductase family protein [Halomonas sp. HP20-15]|uniref:TlpA family protein disulfide reductase n=1 Tax=Halomonas sp. HP20-15 TaxID=3085901 RepID=UPI002981BF94|nr:TlpA disulfide reductase family protein [Halomonas sp. HP20-15]MDW5376158.1 TlpA disulfide reductase family protein [Halomonas sp. HP20-15]